MFKMQEIRRFNQVIIDETCTNEFCRICKLVHCCRIFLNSMAKSDGKTVRNSLVLICELVFCRVKINDAFTCLIYASAKYTIKRTKLCNFGRKFLRPPKNSHIFRISCL